jgi:hypothetical protein
MPDIQGEDHTSDRNIWIFIEKSGSNFKFGEEGDNCITPGHSTVCGGLIQADTLGPGRFCERGRSREGYFPMASVTVPCQICCAISLTYAAVQILTVILVKRMISLVGK